MTQKEFLKRLQQALIRTDPNERTNAVAYYEEYFADLGLSDYDEVPTTLKDPEKIAADIEQDIPYSQSSARAEQSEPLDFESIPLSAIRNLDIDLSVCGLEIEIADISRPELKRPNQIKGNPINYEIDCQVNDDTIIIRDRYSDLFFNRLTRIQFAPLILRLPQNTYLEKAKLVSKMGSTKLFNLQSHELEVYSQMGKAVFKGGHTQRLKCRLEMGSIKMDHFRAHESRIDISMGDLRGNATLLGSHQLSCEMGNIKLSLNQSKEDTQVNAQVTVGSFHINHQKINTKTLDTGTGHNLASLHLKVSMGNVSLDFKD